MVGVQVWVGKQVWWACRCGGRAGMVGVEVWWAYRCGGRRGMVGVQLASQEHTFRTVCVLSHTIPHSTDLGHSAADLVS